MKLRVLWLGRPQASPFETAVESYRRRVNRRWPAIDAPLRPAAGGRDRDPRRALRLEAEAIERSLEPGWRLIALDERGRALDSERLARRLEALADRGTEGLAFVIGSDLGLDPVLRARADDCWSLSPLTLPHALARLVLWEQLYRATQILAGGAYHRDGVQ